MKVVMMMTVLDDDVVKPILFSSFLDHDPVHCAKNTGWGVKLT